jgi:hypothetical protein
VIIPLPTRSSALDLYAFKTMQLTNWEILMRHIVRYRKSATLLQDSGKEKVHIHFFCLETLQLGEISGWKKKLRLWHVQNFGQKDKLLTSCPIHNKLF